MSRAAVMVIRIELADGEERVSATMTSGHHISSTCTTVSMGDTHGGICIAFRCSNPPTASSKTK